MLGEVVYVAGLGPNIGTFGFDAKTGKKVFESDLGEYNPVISDGERMYLTGTTARAFIHESMAEQKRAAHRRQARRQRQRAAHSEARAPSAQREATASRR